MNKWLILILGIALGIGIDRVNLKKVLQEKEKDLERYRENFFVMGEWLTMFERKQTIVAALKKRGITNVGIYGMGILGSHLYKQLEKSEIKVTYLIDRNDIKGVYSAEVVKPNQILKNTDAVIVTPVYQFENIKRAIQEYNTMDVISLKTLINMEDI